jgi:hypothetical protein
MKKGFFSLQRLIRMRVTGVQKFHSEMVWSGERFMSMDT